MADTTITALPTAASVDATQDWIAIDSTSLATTQKVNRNTYLGITGSPVGTTDTQVMSNKTVGNTNTVTLKDTLFTLQDDGDTTKQAKFQLSGITTATTRTYTLPDASSTLADLTTAQIFTNKTITSPVITGGTIDNSAITVDSIAGHTSATTGSIYGISVTSGLMSGASLSNNSIPATAYGNSTVAASKINFGGSGSGVWWEEIGRTTLGVAGATISVTSLPARSYLAIIVKVNMTGAGAVSLLLNNDSGNNYARRLSTNGGADATTTPASLFVNLPAGQYPWYLTGEIVNMQTEEKTITFNAVSTNTAGVANVPNRYEGVGKWTNTADQINRIDVSNSGAGNFTANSTIIVLGHN